MDIYSTPSSKRRTMPPPPVPDHVMAPPPPPNGTGKSLDAAPPDIAAKYQRLKRKYYDMEMKWKDTNSELNAELSRAAEHNRRLKHEKSALLDRILELESSRAPALLQGTDVPLPPSAFPHPQLAPKLNGNFASNLAAAMDEPDDDDPRQASRHVGKRAEEERERERRAKEEEKEREVKKGPLTRKPRMSTRKSDVQTAPLTFAPSPSLASNTGTKIRIKPIAPPEALPPPPPVAAPVQPPALPSPAEMLVDTPMEARSLSPTESPTSTSAPANGNGTVLKSKPKRIRAHLVQSKTYSIPLVPRDKNNRPLLPLTVGIITVHSLGEICMREHFHTERYIFPVGYEITRRYLSAIDPHREVTYTCRIIDGGDGPQFKITPEDSPDQPIIAGTATGAWSGIVRQANLIRERAHSNSVSGPDYFGLGQNTIKHLIQQLPGADQLMDYVWQHFNEGGPLGGRHAAVHAAKPEDGGQKPRNEEDEQMYNAPQMIEPIAAEGPSSAPASTERRHSHSSFPPPPGPGPNQEPYRSPPLHLPPPPPQPGYSSGPYSPQPQQQQAQVPPGFASIMNAYPSPNPQQRSGDYYNNKGPDSPVHSPHHPRHPGVSPPSIRRQLSPPQAPYPASSAYSPPYQQYPPGSGPMEGTD